MFIVFHRASGRFWSFFPTDNQTEMCVFDANSHGAEEVCCCACVCVCKEPFRLEGTM